MQSLMMFNMGARAKGIHGANTKVNHQIADMYGIKL